MGNEVSIPSDIFDQETIQKLSKKFAKLDVDKSGSLTLEEIQDIPKLKQNPLVQRVVSIFDLDENGSIDFKEFITGLSTFSSKVSTEEKCKFMFNIYDMNRDGYISNGELFQVLKMMVGNNLKDDQLQQIVDKTILKLDLDKDGRISIEEFLKMNICYSSTLQKIINSQESNVVCFVMHKLDCAEHIAMCDFKL